MDIDTYTTEETLPITGVNQANTATEADLKVANAAKIEDIQTFQHTRILHNVRYLDTYELFPDYDKKIAELRRMKSEKAQEGAYRRYRPNTINFSKEIKGRIMDITFSESQQQPLDAEIVLMNITMEPVIA